MTESEAIEKLEFLNEALSPQFPDSDECSCALQMGMDAIKEVQQHRAIGTVSEFREAMFFKKYFMELYGEGLEVANWHQNGDLEPLDNFIDEAFEWGKKKEREEHE